MTEQTRVISFLDQPVENPPTLFITGSFNTLASLHMSIEITDTCNFRCEHCYVSSSPWKLGKREGKETRMLMDTMSSNGVKVIELTGGERTTHPEFKEILAYASEKFHLVGIITNGYLLGVSGDLADWVSSFGNVTVQISLDGMTRYAL